MNGRERLEAALNHIETDRPPVDLGSCGQTGVSASTLYKLRGALGLPQTPVKVIEPFQMLGEIDEDVRKALSVDVVGLWNRGTFFGYNNENWKPWTMRDGTPVLMAGGFEYDTDEKGDIWLYPQGDRTVPYSAHMPDSGYFFDNIERAPAVDEAALTPVEDYQDDFATPSDEDLIYWEVESKRLYEETDYGIMGVLGGAGLGDVAMIPGPAIKNPKGIRTIEGWLMAHLLYPDYVREVFKMQTEAALKSLVLYREAVGDRIQAVWLSGTDFATQNSLFMAIDTFRDLYKPYYETINGWVHEHTKWKTFYHTCGAVEPLIDDLIEMGVDILNPVQCTAKGMEPRGLKEKYGDRVVFWGGAADSQTVLPYGTPEEVAAQARERIEIFSKGGGYVFASIHNIVAKVPPENVIALFGAVNRK